jgi:hypothetical protein
MIGFGQKAKIPPTVVGGCVQVLSKWKYSVEDLRIPHTAVWGWFRSTLFTFVKMKIEAESQKSK